jgi:hypothetical protein
MKKKERNESNCKTGIKKYAARSRRFVFTVSDIHRSTLYVQVQQLHSQAGLSRQSSTDPLNNEASWCYYDDETIVSLNSKLATEGLLSIIAMGAKSKDHR